MDEENPLYFKSPQLCSNVNRSGRPTNENLIKFSPQPSSLISQMLQKIKHENIIPDCNDPDTLNDIDCDNLKNKWDDANNSLEFMVNEKNTKCELLLNSKPKKELFPCDYPKCNYVSKLLSNLTKHKRTHTMEKPYLCDQCCFRSNFVNSLKVHKRIHTKERPYRCTYCTYCCNSSSNLKKHTAHKHKLEII